jgi:hypothetical protein
MEDIKMLFSGLGFHPDKYTKNNLRELNETEGQSLLNKFAVILRKHPVDFQVRLFNLHTKGLYAFLEKELFAVKIPRNFGSKKRFLQKIVQNSKKCLILQSENYVFNMLMTVVNIWKLGGCYSFKIESP